MQGIRGRRVMAKPTILNKEMFITRAFGTTFTTSDGETGKVIEGHAAVYEQKVDICGYFYEVIKRGAFDGTDLTDVLFFVNHDTSKIPLARSRRNNPSSTMQLKTDEKGLFMSSKVDTETNEESKKLYGSINRGDMDGMSFMFNVQDETWTDLNTDMPTRSINKIGKVYEVSAVNMPAYSDTDISARDKTTLDNAEKALDNARSRVDTSKNDVEVQRLKIQILMKG